MAVREFFAPDARDRVTDAVRRAESHTCAEIVVAVHGRSGDYRHVDVIVGFALATVGLLVFLFHPMSFSIEWFPLEFVGIFALGVLLSWSLPPLRRAFTTASWRASHVRRNALATFHELGVDRTAGRTGVLVMLSAMEHDCFIVCDRGIDEQELGESWKIACSRVREASRGRRFSRGDLDALTQAIAGLGEALAARYPRQADDVNELPDDVRVS